MAALAAVDASFGPLALAGAKSNTKKCSARGETPSSSGQSPAPTSSQCCTCCTRTRRNRVSPRGRARGAASKDYDIAHVWAACMAFAACASSSPPGDPVGHARHDALLIDSGLPAFAGRYLRTCERRHCICSKFAARHEVTDIESTVGRWRHAYYTIHVMYANAPCMQLLHCSRYQACDASAICLAKNYAIRPSCSVLCVSLHITHIHVTGYITYMPTHHASSKASCNVHACDRLSVCMWHPLSSGHERSLLCVFYDGPFMTLRVTCHAFGGQLARFEAEGPSALRCFAARNNNRTLCAWGRGWQHG